MAKTRATSGGSGGSPPRASTSGGPGRLAARASTSGGSGGSHPRASTSGGPGRLAARASTVGLDLHLELTGSRVRAGLERALREAAASGRLLPGTRLPSSRALAADLGIARNTVADSYGQLIAEGWLEARHGSGTWV